MNPVEAFVDWLAGWMGTLVYLRILKTARGGETQFIPDYLQLA